MKMLWLIFAVALASCGPIAEDPNSPFSSAHDAAVARSVILKSCTNGDMILVDRQTNGYYIQRPGFFEARGILRNVETDEQARAICS